MSSKRQRDGSLRGLIRKKEILCRQAMEGLNLNHELGMIVLLLDAPSNG